MRTSMAAWAIFTAINAGAVGTVILTGSSAGESSAVPTAWWVLALVTFGVVIPAAFFAHRRCFRRYWEHGVVKPQGYLRAYLLLWTGLTLAVVAHGVSALVAQRMNSDFLAMLPPAFMQFATWPNGWAMSDRVSRRDEAIEQEEEILHVHERT